VQWKSNKYYIFWVFVCSLRYPARNAHAAYSLLWPVPLYKIFPHYLLNNTVLEKKVIETTMCVFDFSLKRIWNIFHSKIIKRGMMINVYWSLLKVRVIIVRSRLKKGKGRLWVLQHWCLEAYCTLTRMCSFIHLQRRCTHQASTPLLAKEGTIPGI